MTNYCHSYQNVAINARLELVQPVINYNCYYPANLYDSLIGFHPHWLNGLQGMSSLAMDVGQCGIFFRIHMSKCSKKYHLYDHCCSQCL